MDRASVALDLQFSLCKRILTDQRHAMTDETFEILIYLIMNMRYWNVEDVARVIAVSHEI